MNSLKLRPHHLLDIITSHGHGEQFAPHHYGHALHTVAALVLADDACEIEFVIGADAICAPCCHLQANGQCDDILRQFDPPMTKQAYNDALDRRLFDLLGLTSANRMTMRQFLEMIKRMLPGIATVCAHRGETPEGRLEGLQKGLAALAGRAD